MRRSTIQVASEPAAAAPYVEARVRDGEVLLSVDAPGLVEGEYGLRVTRQAIDIQAWDGSLGCIRVPLPVPVRTDSVAAARVHGVLEVRLRRAG